MTDSVTLIRGWNFKLNEYEQSWKEVKLLVGNIETSNICDMLCDYCFREDLGVSKKRRLKGEISLEETLKVIREMSKLGVRSINIIGAGEPILDPSFEEILRYISGRGIIPVVFTHGGMLNDDLIDKLNRNHASVILKVNSFNPDIQDRLVRKPGYTKRRDEGLQKLLKAGFNLPAKDGSYQTRLGIDSVVCRENKHEIIDIFRFCRNNNIMPLIKTFIPAGRTKDRTDMEITMSEYIELSKNVRDIDRKYYEMHYDSLVPYLGGVPCTQNGMSSMYVTVLGDIFECPGQEFNYGNIRNVSIKDAFEKIRGEQTNFSFGCPPRISYWKRTGHFSPEEKPTDKK